MVSITLALYIECRSINEYKNIFTLLHSQTLINCLQVALNTYMNVYVQSTKVQKKQTVSTKDSRT